MGTLSLEQLRKLVQDGVAVRGVATLEPAGRPSDKVFPPTHSVKDGETKYAFEKRRIAGAEIPCVVLDSVQSQANRMEEALLSAWEQKKLHFPVIGVDFSGDPELVDLGSVTSLQAPHRIADAILRDATSIDGKTLFRDLPAGKAFTEANIKNATAVYSLCPTALIFGVWDSTGPKGGLGAKFQRALTSEIASQSAKSGPEVTSGTRASGYRRRTG